MYFLFDKKWRNVVMTLKLHRFYTLHCICLIFSSKDSHLCVLAFSIKNVALV